MAAAKTYQSASRGVKGAYTRTVNRAVAAGASTRQARAAGVRAAGGGTGAA